MALIALTLKEKKQSLAMPSLFQKRRDFHQAFSLSLLRAHALAYSLSSLLRSTLTSDSL